MPPFHLFPLSFLDIGMYKPCKWWDELPINWCMAVWFWLFLSNRIAVWLSQFPTLQTFGDFDKYSVGENNQVQFFKRMVWNGWNLSVCIHRYDVLFCGFRINWRRPPVQFYVECFGSWLGLKSTYLTDDWYHRETTWACTNIYQLWALWENKETSPNRC